ncbi:hypothetical protein ATCV1_z037L [Acanthocystis turfacea chlorella virus 1]|uniref:Uncharacterized protein z037L n=1 Tax=Chlorovirus heliozoae TaxID=322019 RepID=A7K7Z7_9PHYC|nr:hypothetical protein ATCV1_z037L [Acanthocystis turfacea chlorella virus 1]ABT16171.1 hypothetical protein ATCV1_z037L [Acanthocystis turfacea chlorella virus 1]
MRASTASNTPCSLMLLLRTRPSVTSSSRLSRRSLPWERRQRGPRNTFRATAPSQSASSPGCAWRVFCSPGRSAPFSGCATGGSCPVWVCPTSSSAATRASTSSLESSCIRSSRTSCPLTW